MAAMRKARSTRKSVDRLEPVAEKVELILAGMAIAVLVASGFEETHMTDPQRGLLKLGAKVKIISPEPGLVHSWHHDGWGHFFPVDHPLEQALGSDFDVLILPGGERSIARLRDNPHTRRVVGHFIDADKPLAAIAEAVGLLMIEQKIRGRRLATDLRSIDPRSSSELPAASEEASTQSSDQVVLDKVLLSASSSDQLAQWNDQLLTLLSQSALQTRTAV